jgi:hypothetical protein
VSEIPQEELFPAAVESEIGLNRLGILKEMKPVFGDAVLIPLDPQKLPIYVPVFFNITPIM